MTTSNSLLIGLVGPCGSGKSTLQSCLIKRGFKVRHIAQEHSYVPDMWQRITNPDLLIFLDASFPTTIDRRQIDWNEDDYAEQQQRLLHARRHADIYIQTDSLSVQQVQARVMEFLLKWRRKNTSTLKGK